MSPILIVILLAMFVLPGAMYFIYKTLGDKKAKAFLEQNPNAVKVYINGLSMSGIYSVAVYVNAVDDQDPINFMDGFKGGFYLTPGIHVLQATSTMTRPGVMYKTVSKEYGPVDVSVEVEIGKEYTFSFDADQEIFTLQERI